ncbi:MAG: class I mannose-6-phosphate isomerase [Lentisphaeraceae bacterium]|nr:class I mannose-6-phosphate isomerase [Lentisphaeraceae bacterium]
MDLHIYPLLFNPILKERLWGGEKLYKYLDTPKPDTDKNIGECWFISDREDEQVTVANGAYEGLPLNDLVKSYPAKFVGNRHQGSKRFPLIFKYVDAGKRQSLHVHPDEMIARKHPGTESKNEVLYVLDHDDHSEIYAGLRHDRTQLQFRTRVGSNDLEECLQTFPSRNGDAFYIPAGTVHCVGEGNLVMEVIQNSDTTFRVHDWDRECSEGRKRDLQVEEALESIHFKDRTLPLVRADESPITSNRKKDLVRNNKYFKCEEIKLVDEFFSNTSPKTFNIIIPVDSEITISCDAGNYKLVKGQPCLLPAALGAYKVHPETGGTSTILRAMLSM